MTTIDMLGNNLLITIHQEQYPTVTHDITNELLSIGRVVASGKETKHKFLPGDTIAFHGNQAKYLDKFDDADYYVVSEYDVTCVVKNVDVDSNVYQNEQSECSPLPHHVVIDKNYITDRMLYEVEGKVQYDVSDWQDVDPKELVAAAFNVVVEHLYEGNKELVDKVTKVIEDELAKAKSTV